MHDAAPVHYCRVVSDYLTTFYPDGRSVRNALGKTEIQTMCRRNIISQWRVIVAPGTWPYCHKPWSSKHCYKTTAGSVPPKLCKAFYYPYGAFFTIYNLTTDCTIMLNTIVTNNMLLSVSTFKMSSSGSSVCLTKITYRYLGLGKIKLLKYEMINFNKMLIVQRDKSFS